MSVFKDLSNQKFNKLTVLSFSHKRLRISYWNCKCDCGNELIVQGASLKNNHSKSCGCLRIKHGFSKASEGRTSEYRSWNAMKNRCLNANHPSFKYWGARGIKICERWMKFENFIADMGRKPEGYTIERIDNNANYTPQNCKWASAKEQAANRRPRTLTINGA